MAIRSWWPQVRDSLWFVPTIWVLVSAVLAFGLIVVDTRTPDFARQFPLVFGGGAEGARGLLSSIAGSMITVAGVTFSITIVALQLASSQFSPRVLRTFMRDRSSQIVLGSFIGAFVYAILVLRSIRSEIDDAEAFVPSLAVTGGIAYALLALGMLVYFVHHIATRIQISTMVGSIARETTEQIADTWPDRPPDGESAEPEGSPGPVPATASGYLQLVDADRLVEIAERHDLVVRLELRTGEWVQEHAPLFTVWPASAASDDLARELREGVTLGDQRSVEQDAAFGLRQLVDVAVKAISPGINDPTSATDCIDRLGQILVAAGTRHVPGATRRDEAGTLRLIVPERSWDELVDLAFDQLRHYGRGSPDIALSLLTTLRTVGLATPPVRHAALGRQAARIAGSVATLSDEEARDRIRQAHARVRDALGGPAGAA